MKNQYDLAQLDWTLSGWTPYLWQFQPSLESGASPDALVSVPAKVPGSVQHALRTAGLLPDWNVGLNARACEWVENRQWLYETTLPDAWLEKGKGYQLSCQGLDYRGWVYLNGRLAGSFCGTHIPHTFDLTPYLVDHHNVLRIAFDLPPRWLGQFGYTSQMREWKVRFNYTWDWQPRLVQIGIWDKIEIVATDGLEITSLRCTTDVDVASTKGQLSAQGRLVAPPGAKIRAALTHGGATIRQEELPASVFAGAGVQWEALPVELWWPNLEGGQPLYDFEISLLDAGGKEIDRARRRVGFRHIAWQACEGAPAQADPWICVVNGKPIFLQGVNFPPVRPNFADVSEADYRPRLELYRELGMNTFRINACGFLETECFYNLCDELGFLVWQEFPLTSSGVENMPPNDETSIEAVAEIAASFITRRQHHPSLLLWSGGNELVDLNLRPLNNGHPMLRRLESVAHELDPLRRFITASPSGPRFGGSAAEYGQGLNWDVHGEWKPAGTLAEWEAYWKADDALFRSEVGAPGCAPVELIRKYKGNCQELPVHPSNPFWRNPIAWWLQAEQFEAELGHPPTSLEEYAAWSQDRQARALVTAVKACKDRFPRCGGALLWMGHDTFPCPTNTAIVDFEGKPKPAALALKEVWRKMG
jgi:beta-mannosidase